MWESFKCGGVNMMLWEANSGMYVGVYLYICALGRVN